MLSLSYIFCTANWGISVKRREVGLMFQLTSKKRDVLFQRERER